MQSISTKDAPGAIGPYSQAVATSGLVFASGQIALDPQSGNLVGTTVAEQTRQVMNNIAGLLKACNACFDQVIKSTCFLTDMNAFEEFNQVYGTYFTQHLPARSAVEVAALPKGALVEVEVVIAVKGV